MALLPNATHILQPMDVGVFHPLKAKWLKAVQQWRFDNNGDRFRREHFAPLLKGVIDDAINPAILAGGFRKCGLYPFSPDAIDYVSIIKNYSTQPSPTDITPPVSSIQNHESRPVDLSGFLSFFENMVGEQKISLFRDSVEGWGGDIEDTSLFALWKKFNMILTAEISLQGNMPEIVSFAYISLI